MPRELLRIYTLRSEPENLFVPSDSKIIPKRDTEGGSGLGWFPLSDRLVRYYYKDSLTGSVLSSDLEYNIVEDTGGRYGVLRGLPDRDGRWYIRIPRLEDSAADGGIVGSEYFEFHINPERIEISDEKAKTQVRTRAGYEYQHWGNKPTSVSVSGLTGGLGASLGEGIDGVGKQYGTVRIEDTRAYQRLKDLEELYRKDQEIKQAGGRQKFLLAIYYRGEVYVGHFDTFTFTESSDRPYVFEYSFRFTAEFKESDVRFARRRLSVRLQTDLETVRRVQELRSTG